MVYQLPRSIFLYAALICFSVGLVYLVYDFYRYQEKHTHLMKIKNSITSGVVDLPQPTTLAERNYQQLIRIQHQNQQELVAATSQKHEELIDYYTLWTHQIKTPLAAIRLLLQSDNLGNYEELELQILEVEKYVEMALQYLRIDSMAADLTLEKYSIQQIVKQAIKSYSKTFIYKGIRLNLADTDQVVVTDEKWLLFVVKQILSNSLKYTDSGQITIDIKDDTLLIKDTGIGIQPEDIPRIFEKGFTGYGGRIDEHSTGIGLYLTKRILDNLGHPIEISSDGESGTAVRIGLSRIVLETE